MSGITSKFHFVTIFIIYKYNICRYIMNNLHTKLHTLCCNISLLFSTKVKNIFYLELWLKVSCFMFTIF